MINRRQGAGHHRPAWLPLRRWGFGVARPFSPQGYLGSQEAIGRAAAKWFPDTITALETAAARELADYEGRNADNQQLTPIEAAARAFAPPPSLSESLQRQIDEVLEQAEHRLRGLLHQGVIAAFYFGGLFRHGAHAVESEFWAMPEADGVLLSGSIYPFGQPSSFYEQRPKYQVFLLETGLDALLGDSSKPPLPDTTNAPFGEEDKSHSEQARGAAPQTVPGRAGAKTQGIHEAVNSLWPSGIPKGLSAKERDQAIIGWLRQEGYSVPKNPARAIQRALKALRSR